MKHANHLLVGLACTISVVGAAAFPASADPFHDSLRKLQQRTAPKKNDPPPGNAGHGSGTRPRVRRYASLPARLPHYTTESGAPPPKAGPPPARLQPRLYSCTVAATRAGGKNPKMGDLQVKAGSPVRIMIGVSSPSIGHAEGTDLKPRKSIQVQVQKPVPGARWQSVYVPIRAGMTTYVTIKK